MCLKGFFILLFSALAAAGHTVEYPKLRQIAVSNPRLRRQLASYRNCALWAYTNYLDQCVPYADHPQAYYGSLGNCLIAEYGVSL